VPVLCGRIVRDVDACPAVALFVGRREVSALVGGAGVAAAAASQPPPPAATGKKYRFRDSKALRHVLMRRGGDWIWRPCRGSRRAL